MPRRSRKGRPRRAPGKSRFGATALSYLAVVAVHPSSSQHLSPHGAIIGTMHTARGVPIP